MTKQEYEEREELEKQMEEWALAEPEPLEWFDEAHPTADAEPPEWYLETEPMEWMEQELLEQAHKEAQKNEPVSAEQELLDLHYEWLREQGKADTGQ